MATNVLADSGFLVALLNDGDSDHAWAVAEAHRYPPAWTTCDAAVSEAFYLLGPTGTDALTALLQRRAVKCEFALAQHVDEVVRLMKKYADVPMALADACLVRMTEMVPNPMLLTTDTEFRVYRRHGRQIIPCMTPR